MKKEPANLIKTSSFELAIYAKGDESSDKLTLVLPGRLDTKDYIHMTSHVDLLASLGFYAISFDPPYSWESPGDIKNYSTTNYIKAVNELIEYYGNKPALLVGHSRGGAVSILASSNPNVKALALLMANYGNTTEPSPREIRGNYAVSMRDIPPGSSRTQDQKEFLLPLSYFKDSKQYHPAMELAKFKGPKLIICGTNDLFIPPEKVKEVYDSLSEPKMFLELNTEHDYRLSADMIEQANTAIKEFVEKYL